MDDRYSPSFCPCGCHVSQLLEVVEPPHEPCCCCTYNPFCDTSKEHEIQDLSFAMRKLTVMKCQMKKWRMERLQLESENRSLKQTLQSLGILNFYFTTGLYIPFDRYAIRIRAMRETSNLQDISIMNISYGFFFLVGITKS